MDYACGLGSGRQPGSCVRARSADPDDAIPNHRRLHNVLSAWEPDEDVRL